LRGDPGKVRDDLLQPPARVDELPPPPVPLLFWLARNRGYEVIDLVLGAEVQTGDVGQDDVAER
jgi:hypothetical protein